MSEISKIEIPSGSVFDIKDSTARSGLNSKADIDSPAFTSSISMGRKAETTIGTNSVATGTGVTASGNYSHAEGSGTTASGANSHAEGYYSTASGLNSRAEGDYTTASGIDSHAEGDSTVASGNYSHTEGGSTTASGNYSHAEGSSTTASSPYAHSEGYRTKASESSAHAEGTSTIASGIASHAEGISTKAEGFYSHAEGYSTSAKGLYSHAEGYNTIARGAASHAGGSSSVAAVNDSFAHGSGLISNNYEQFSFGSYNVPSISSSASNYNQNVNYSFGNIVKYDNNYYMAIDAIDQSSEAYVPESSNKWKRIYAEANNLSFLETIGNGTYTSFKNARALTTSGDERLSGMLYVNCKDNSTGGREVSTILEFDGNDTVATVFEKLDALPYNKLTGISMIEGALSLFIPTYATYSAFGSVVKFEGTATGNDVYRYSLTYGAYAMLAMQQEAPTSSSIGTILYHRMIGDSASQEIDGTKTFISDVYFKNNSRTPRICFGASDITSVAGVIRMPSVSDGNGNYNQAYFTFDEYGPSSNASVRSSYPERYVLPTPNSGRTSTATYEIYTTKEGIVFKDGERFYIPNRLFGAVTSSGTSVQFSVAAPKTIPSGATLTTNFSPTLRTMSGSTVSVTGATVEIVRENENTARIMVSGIGSQTAYSALYSLRSNSSTSFYIQINLS